MTASSRFMMKSFSSSLYSMPTLNALLVMLTTVSSSSSSSASVFVIPTPHHPPTHSNHAFTPASSGKQLLLILHREPMDGQTTTTTDHMFNDMNDYDYEEDADTRRTRASPTAGKTVTDSAAGGSRRRPQLQPQVFLIPSPTHVDPPSHETRKTFNPHPESLVKTRQGVSDIRSIRRRDDISGGEASDGRTMMSPHVVLPSNHHPFSVSHPHPHPWITGFHHPMMIISPSTRDTHQADLMVRRRQMSASSPAVPPSFAPGTTTTSSSCGSTGHPQHQLLMHSPPPPTHASTRNQGLASNAAALLSSLLTSSSRPTNDGLVSPFPPISSSSLFTSPWLSASGGRGGSSSSSWLTRAQPQPTAQQLLSSSPQHLLSRLLSPLTSATAFATPGQRQRQPNPQSVNQWLDQLEQLMASDSRRPEKTHYESGLTADGSPDAETPSSHGDEEEPLVKGSNDDDRLANSTVTSATTTATTRDS